MHDLRNLTNINNTEVEFFYPVARRKSDVETKIDRTEFLKIQYFHKFVETYAL